MPVDYLVEGVTDRFVVDRLLRQVGAVPGRAFGLSGCDYIRRKIAGFMIRARFGDPLFVLADKMDLGDGCCRELLEGLAPERPANACVRLAVNELESWLLADSEGISRFLRVRRSLVPTAPDELDDPKRSLVNLARSGRSRHAMGIVPKPGLSGVVGPDYVESIAIFVASEWDPERASHASPSLAKAVQRLTELVAREEATRR